jgi:hypothetical protein
METESAPLAYSVPQAARVLGMQRSELYALIKFTDIPVHRIAGRMALDPGIVAALRARLPRKEAPATTA